MLQRPQAYSVKSCFSCLVSSLCPTSFPLGPSGPHPRGGGLLFRAFPAPSRHFSSSSWHLPALPTSIFTPSIRAWCAVCLSSPHAAPTVRAARCHRRLQWGQHAQAVSNTCHSRMRPGHLYQCCAASCSQHPMGTSPAPTPPPPLASQESHLEDGGALLR